MSLVKPPVVLLGISVAILLVAEIPPPISALDRPLQVTLSEDVIGFCDSTVWNEVDFHANITGGLRPYDYAWSFGDGSPNSTLDSPSHSYENPGRYTANVTVTDSGGNRASASSTFFVVPPSCALRVLPPAFLVTVLFLAAFVTILTLTLIVPFNRRLRGRRH